MKAQNTSGKVGLKRGVLDRTSQSGGEEEVSSVFPDQAFCDSLQGWAPPQLADGVLEFGIEEQRQASAASGAVLPLRCQAVDLPSTKLPGHRPCADAFVSRLSGEWSLRCVCEAYIHQFATLT